MTLSHPFSQALKTILTGETVRTCAQGASLAPGEFSER